MRPPRAASPPAVLSWPIAKLIPYGRNPRKNDHAVKQMAACVKEFGFKVPILARSTGEIVDGHLRFKAAQALGLKTVPVMLCDEWTDAQVKAFRIMVNKSSEWAEWDNDLLKLDLADLQAFDFDLAFTGFEKGELSTMLADHGLKGNPDEAPPVPKKPITRPGDLWILGDHRLLCGDSTKPEDVARVMDGQKAMLMATDPPYGINYDNTERPNPGVAKPRIAKPRVANDEITDGPAMQAFLEAMLQAALPSMQTHAAFYFWHPMLTQGTYVAAAAAAGILIHRQIIWVKPGLLLGRGDYHWRHELCFYGWQQGNRPPFYGARNQDTIWEVSSICNKERKELGHATPKPVALWEKPFANHTLPGEIAFEPFSGSGTTIIAAEMLGRKCYALELAPGYCDVAAARWEKLTGRKAERRKAVC